MPNKSTKLTLVNQDVDTSFFTIERTWQGLRSPIIKNQIGVSIKTSVAEIKEGKTINTFMSEAELKKVTRACAQALLNNPKLASKYKANTIRTTKKIRDLATINYRKATKLSDKEIIKLLEQLSKLQIDSLINGTVVAFADIYGEIGDALTKIVNKRKNLSLPISNYTSQLGQPEQPSLTALAYEEINQSNKSKKFLTQKYFWLEQGYIGRGLIEKQLQHIQAAHKKPKIANRIKLETELKLSPAEKQTFNIVQDIVFTKSLRADSRQFCYVVMNKILDSLAKKWKVKPEYLETLSLPEICSILKGKNKVPENLAQRWYHSVLIPKKPSGYKILLGNKATEFLQQNLLKETIKNSEISGQIAYTGKTKGKVRLVFGPQHNNKVKKGDILVSTSTSPQLLPAMKLAGAYITDVGGITSHAAIVARELKKPCIVGTKYATQILSDGDIIEVDANTGKVRLIKKFQ